MLAERTESIIIAECGRIASAKRTAPQVFFALKKLNFAKVNVTHCEMCFRSAALTAVTISSFFFSPLKCS